MKKIFQYFPHQSFYSKDIFLKNFVGFRTKCKMPTFVVFGLLKMTKTAEVKKLVKSSKSEYEIMIFGTNGHLWGKIRPGS